ncbi:hypothetical protein AGMMS4952_17970 [Spirochaetia bacterium]|nr:hypothetical protein AGMMS4952_17970 [Spirochaetia bacterium]
MMMISRRLKCFFPVLLGALLSVNIFAQESRDGRLSASLVLDAEAFRLTSETYERADIRVKSYQDTTLVQLPLSNISYWKDSKLNVGYDAGRWGGRISMTQESLANSGFGGLAGWVNVGFLRISIGNDIKSTYAESLGADPELRLYTGKSGDSVAWDASKNPDNITGDEGVLLEASLASFSFALAAGGYLASLTLEDPITNTNIFPTKDAFDLRYGARVGYNLPKAGKLNVSYMIEGKKIATMYGRKTDSSDIVPKQAQAEFFDHSFGLYASLNPSEDFDLTIGYNGALTSYLSEFYNQSLRTMVETGYPIVFKNGLNVNGRWRKYPLTFRTDNSLTYWEDKNYSLFETGNSAWIDLGLLDKNTADQYAGINHFVLWDGFGVSYRLTEVLSLGSYLSNLFSFYTAKGGMPGGSSGTYTFFRDELSFDISATISLNANIEAYIKLGVVEKITFRSRDLNVQTRGFFIQNINNNSSNPAPTPVETTDSSFWFRIPIGITVKF